MKKTIAFFVLLSALGCNQKEDSSEPNQPAAPIVSMNSVTAKEVQVEVMGWLSAYAKAEATKTHASGDHPQAQAAMDQHELNLQEMKKKNLPLVKKVVMDLHNQFHQQKAAIIQKRNQMQVVGRTLTEEEQKYVDVIAPRQLEQISARDNAFHEFLKMISE